MPTTNTPLFSKVNASLKISGAQIWILILGIEIEEWSWVTVLGWRLPKLRSLISPLAKFKILQKYLLDYLNQIHIWQVPPQLSCGDTCQI